MRHDERMRVHSEIDSILGNLPESEFITTREIIESSDEIQKALYHDRFVSGSPEESKYMHNQIKEVIEKSQGKAATTINDWKEITLNRKGQKKKIRAWINPDAKDKERALRGYDNHANNIAKKAMSKAEKLGSDPYLVEVSRTVERAKALIEARKKRQRELAGEVVSSEQAEQSATTPEASSSST